MTEKGPKILVGLPFSPPPEPERGLRHKHTSAFCTSRRHDVVKQYLVYFDVPLKRICSVYGRIELVINILLVSNQTLKEIPQFLFFLFFFFFFAFEIENRINRARR